MAPGDLERALELSRLADGLCSAYADPNYEASNGMFGGWTVVVALRAAVNSAADTATPSALTINFVDKFDPGTEVRIHARRVGASRSGSHWLSEMKSQHDQRTLACASVVLDDWRESDGHVDVTMPNAPDPDTLGVFHPPAGPQGERTIQRGDYRIPHSRSHRYALPRAGCAS